MVQNEAHELAGLARWPLSVLAVALSLVVLLLVFVVPPFQAPDEHRHFFRAYQLSRGELLPYAPAPGAEEARTVQSLHTQLGGMLPRAIDDLLVATEADRLRFHTSERIEPGRIAGAISVRANENDLVYFRFAHTIAYPPYIYSPQVVGIGIARSITDRVLVHFYAARLANAAIAIALLWVALWAAPCLSPLTFAFWTIPVVQFQAGSLSLDAMVNASAMAFAVICFTKPALRPSRSWVLKILLLTVVCSKLAYAPLCLLLAAERGSKPMKRVLGLLIPVLPLMLWMVLARNVLKPPRTDLDIDPARQFMTILQDPAHTIRILIEDWAQHGGFYLQSAVGILGWLDRPLPTWYAALVYGLVGGGAWMARRPLARSPPLVLLTGVAVAGSLLLIQIALFLTFTPVGLSEIQGVQGRYFLPLLPVALLAMRAITGDPFHPAHLTKAFLAGLVVFWTSTLTIVMASYYII